MPVFYFDVDGVLRDLRAVYEKSPFFKGSPILSYYDDDFSKWWKDTVSDEAKCKAAYEDGPVCTGALEFINKLKKIEGVIVCYLSANGINEFARKFTISFLLKNGFTNDTSDINIVSKGTEKAAFMKRNRGVLVDDKIHTVVKITEPSMAIWIRNGKTDDNKKFDRWNPAYPKMMYENIQDMLDTFFNE